MKSKILKIILFSAVLFLTTASLALALPADEPAEKPTSGTSSQNNIPVTADFFPKIEDAGTSKINLVANLPEGDWYTVIGGVIKLLLAVTGSLAFASFTYGGILLITAQGDETKHKKGKSILYMSIMALVIIAVSYAIVLGITQLKFFQ
jgi:flagellar basal body-associated protein FliL